MENLEQVSMIIPSVLGLVNDYRYNADYTCHELSRCSVGEVNPCTDEAVMSFLSALKNGVETANLVISDIDWEESGNCEGDDLYPVNLHAVKLPDGRYFMELTGRFDKKEYIYRFE